MYKTNSVVLLIVLTFSACTKEDKIDVSPSLFSEEGERFSGGDVTVLDQSTNAFSLQAPTATGAEALRVFVGNSLFTQNWVTAPASTTARDGLGPFFNSKACSGCHPKDGRSNPPTPEFGNTHGLLLRLSVNGKDEHGGTIGDPIYGEQLQDQAILGVSYEGEIDLMYVEISGTYSDGTTYSLRQPYYGIKSLQYGDLDLSVMISPRVGQQVFGLGLLEALSEQTILEYEDEYDSNGDGISGKVNYVWSFEEESLKLGRFGWKANQPSLRQQAAGAFLGDMGITSSLLPNQERPIGINCDTIQNGGDPEITDDNLSDVELYLQTLAVPARRNWDNDLVLEGKELFNNIGCSSCHRATMVTGHHKIGLLSNQKIFPYTDMLLHDMGNDLADNRPDFLANGNEWRTPPLWGLGLVETVNNHTYLMHDGRARSIEEAILWHGGEGLQSKNAFTQLTNEERNKMLTFLNSL